MNSHHIPEPFLQPGLTGIGGGFVQPGRLRV